MKQVFDLVEGERLKGEGVAQAQLGLPLWNVVLLSEAQGTARRLACERPSVTADDVVEHYQLRGVDLPAEIGNAMGSLFAGPGWEVVGYTRSRRVSNRSRVLRQWRRKTE